MAAQRNWFREVHATVGASYRYEAGHSDGEEFYSVAGNELVTGHEIARLVQDIVEPVGIMPSEQDVIRSLASLGYENGWLMRRIRKARDRSMLTARQAVAPAAQDLVSIMRRADTVAVVPFVGDVYEEKLAIAAAEEALRAGSPSAVKALVDATPGLQEKQFNDLEVRRAIIREKPRRRRFGRRAITAGYLAVLDEEERDALFRTKVDEDFLPTHTVGRWPEDILLRRSDMPISLQRDDKKPSGQKVLRGVALGLRVNADDVAAIPRHQLRAYLEQTAHAGQPKVEWHRDEDGVHFDFSEGMEEWWNPLRLRMVHINPLLGALCLLAAHPEVVQQGIGRLERVILSRHSDSSERRKLAGLVPLLLPLHADALLETPTVARLESVCKQKSTADYDLAALLLDKIDSSHSKTDPTIK